MGTKFFIVDDSPIFRKALGDFVTTELNCQVIGEASSGLEALDNDHISGADIIAMDIMMKELDGINATKKLLIKFPGSKILAVTSFINAVSLHLLIDAGFIGGVAKERLFEEMGPATVQIMNGQRFYSKAICL